MKGRSHGAPASAIPGQPVGQAGCVQATPEVSTVQRGLLRSMKTLIEYQAMAVAAKPT